MFIVTLKLIEWSSIVKANGWLLPAGLVFDLGKDPGIDVRCIFGVEPLVGYPSDCNLRGRPVAAKGVRRLFGYKHKRGVLVSVLGRGAYPVGQAFRLLSLNPDVHDLVSRAGIRRWAYGYDRQGIKYKPAIDVEQFSRSSETLSFLELVEVMFIMSSLASGAKWPKVREAARVAARVLPNEPHPFANRRWFVDPAGIYLELGNESGEQVLLEMAGDVQVSMKDVLRGYLKQIRFNEVTGVADSWYPLGFDVPVVVDPQFSFGQPTVSSVGVRTDVLFGHYRAGDSIETIAAWYEVPQFEVEAAVRFEERIQPTAA